MEKAWLEVLEGNWEGWLRLRVKGRSMLPTILPGDSILVKPARLEELHPGDVILLRTNNGLLLHRFRGLTADGKLLTQGDALPSPDPPWPPGALLGKAVWLERNNRLKPIPYQPFILTLWKGLSLARSFLRIILTLAFLALPVHAAVTLTSFTATVEGQAVVLRWETASEVNMLGFYIWRSTSEGGDYSRISGLIPAEGEIVGASYQFTDANVELGQTYFYKLEAMETNGSSEFYGPVSVSLSPPPTPTPTFTPTPLPTLTPTPTPSPTSLPTFTPTPTPTPSPTFTPTPTPTLLPTFTPTPTPSLTFTPSPTPPPTSRPSPTPSPTFEVHPTQVPSATATSLPFVSPIPTTPMPTLPKSPTVALTAKPVKVTPTWSQAKPDQERASAQFQLTWMVLALGGAIGLGLILWGAIWLKRSSE